MQLDSLVFTGKRVFYFWKHLRLPLHQRKLNYSQVKFGCLAISLTLFSEATKHFELLPSNVLNSRDLTFKVKKGKKRTETSRLSQVRPVHNQVSRGLQREVPFSEGRKVKSTHSVCSAAVLLCSLFFAGTLLKNISPCTSLPQTQCDCLQTKPRKSDPSVGDVRSSRQAGALLRHWCLTCQNKLEQKFWPAF